MVAVIPNTSRGLSNSFSASGIRTLRSSYLLSLLHLRGVKGYMGMMTGESEKSEDEEEDMIIINNQK